MKRLLNFPYQIHQIGWMHRHSVRHQHYVLQETYFCFSFNKDTNGIVEVNGKPTQGSIQATFSMLPSGTQLNTLKGSLHDELFISYPPETLESWKRLFGTDRFNFNNVAPDSNLKQLIGQLRDVLDNLQEPAAADTLDRLAFSFITGMYIAESARHEHCSENDFRLQELAARLLQGYEVSQLIKEFGFSRRSFFRQWKQFSPQQTPAQYRLSHQLAKAETLLKQSTLPISMVADQAGFNSVIYFCRLFRQRFQCTPSEYRKERGHLNLPGF